MNRILITGHKGMFGRELERVARALGKEVIGLDLPECDITHRKQIERAIFDAEPDLVLHAAAFTAVDRCEAESDLAYLVNATGTQNVCLAAQKLDVPLLYIPPTTSSTARSRIRCPMTNGTRPIRCRCTANPSGRASALCASCA